MPLLPRYAATLLRKMLTADADAASHAAAGIATATRAVASRLLLRHACLMSFFDAIFALPLTIRQFRYCAMLLTPPLIRFVRCCFLPLLLSLTLYATLSRHVTPYVAMMIFDLRCCHT